MQLKKEFFKNEVREGFFVSSMMKRAWAAQLEVLEDFDQFCKNNNLKYYVSYGTLLGAARHKGFIPWDDDMDVWMIRKDYEKLRKLSDNNALPEGYVLKNAFNTEDYDEPFDRLVNAYNINFSDERLEKFHGFPFAVGLDVFPLDYLPTGKKLENFKEDLMTLIEIFNILRNDEEEKLSKRMRQLLEIKYNYKINSKKNVVNQLVKMIDKTIIKYSEDEGETITATYFWAMRNYTREMKSEWFRETVMLPFEGIFVPAPIDYHEALESQYSNHMKAVRHFENLHDYPFYKKQDNFLFETLNHGLLNKKFDEKEIMNYKSNNPGFDILRNMVEKALLLRKINECVVSLFESEDFENIFELMEKSQEIAIQIGTELEERFDPGAIKDIITKLEDYCEKIYNFTVALNEGEDGAVELIHSIKTICEELIVEISDIKGQMFKKVVFLIDTYSDWKHYEGIYNALKEKNKIKCYVVPIPVYLRDSHFNMSEETEWFEADKIEKEVEIFDYQSFNYTNIDCIIKSNPYDGDSYGDMILPFYYSSKMHEYCRTIIHIPTLDIIDFRSEDVQMMAMAENFVKTQSVVYSDYILLDSKVNRDTYVEILKDVTDKVNWEQRVIFCNDKKNMAETISDLIDKI